MNQHLQSTLVLSALITLLTACQGDDQNIESIYDNKTAEVSSSAKVGGACDVGEIITKFSFTTSLSGHPKGEAAVAIADRINREMNGKLCMQLFPDSQLYRDAETMQALLDGNIHLAAPSMSGLDKYSKKYRLFDLPFLFPNMQAVNNFSNGPKGQELLGAIESKGYVGLSYIYNGLKHFSASQPLVQPKDANGLKFRVQNSEVAVAMINAIGGSARKITFREVYSSLKTQIIDGQENTWSNIYTKKFHEVQDGVTETNHQLLTYLAVTSKKWLDSLDPATRQQFTRIVREESIKANERATRTNERNKQKIISDGHIVRSLNPAQREAWVSIMRPVWNKFKSDIGEDIINAAIAAGQ